MERDWRRLGRALAEAREACGLTQIGMTQELKVSIGPIQTIERGASKRVTTTIRAYAQRVGWTEESIDRVLAGGDPELRADAPPNNAPAGAGSAAGRLAALPARVVQALADDGQLIDATVLNLRRPGGGKAIIVIKGEPDAPPEEIAKDLEEWARREMALRGVIPPDINGGDAAAQA